MIGKIIGALIGAEVEKRLGPVALVLSGAYAAKKLYDRRNNAQPPSAIAIS